MAIETITPAKSLHGSPVIPGDKSVSHRALIFGALAQGESEVLNLLDSGDVNSTVKCLQEMGVKITRRSDTTLVHGKDGYNFEQPKRSLDCGNSGTTMRLLMGVLAGQKMIATLAGDESLNKRPMKRVADPLKLMGADIKLHEDNFAPLTITGKPLHGVDYNLKIASAQIKTAVILAGINASGTTRVTGEIKSRDHTERMLAHFGVEVKSNADMVAVRGGQRLKACRVQVPSDPSTAAFWLGAAVLVPGSEIEMRNVSLNPSRIGFALALRKMGAEIPMEITSQDPEPLGKISGSSTMLKSIHIKEADVPALVDEIPLLAVVATQAHGTTIVEGAEELRVKESDRIDAVAQNLRAMGAQIEVRQDGFVITGPQKLRGAQIESFHDHRIAMAFSIAGLVAQGDTIINNSECVAISYPGFYQTLRELRRG